MKNKFGDIVKPGAFVKPRREVTRIFIHCTASDYDHHDDVSVVDEWHRDRGWDGIGYHYLIKKSGELQVGRSLEKNPVAQAGNNSRTIAICLHGLEATKFTRAQMDTLLTLCDEINLQYQGEVTFHGHREVSNKACPVIDYVSLLGLDAEGNFMGVTQEPLAVQESIPDNYWPTVKREDNGQLVKLVQIIVGTKPDGDFGKKTEAALKAYQKQYGVPETGFTDSYTWACMTNPLMEFKDG